MFVKVLLYCPYVLSAVQQVFQDEEQIAKNASDNVLRRFDERIRRAQAASEVYMQAMKGTNCIKRLVTSAVIKA